MTEREPAVRLWAMDADSAAEERVRRQEAMHIIGRHRIQIDEEPAPRWAYALGWLVLGAAIGAFVGGVL